MKSIKLLIRAICIGLLIFLNSFNTVGQSNSEDMQNALSHLNAGKLKQAIKGFTREIKQNTKNPQAYYYRAMARAMSGDIDRAVLDLQNTIDLKPDFGEAYNLYGQIFLTQGENDMKNVEIALWAFNKAIKYDSLSENIYSYRAEAKFRLGDKWGCCADLEKAVALKEPMAASLNSKYCGNPMQGGESLMLHYPEEENWKLETNFENDQLTMMELVRNNETLENWTEIATTKAFKGAINTDLEETMNFTFKQLNELCPKAELTFIEKDLDTKFPWIIFTIECPKYKDDKTAESQLWYMIQGKTSLYSSFRAIRSAGIPEATRQKWIEFFKSGKIIYMDEGK